ncbi:hypothetical protein [Holzapfeliella floricola]|uniref:hypothetical protein n=1 Tax=Holzapfeliella floricola TaxID=679249 RepID=UPI000704B5C0|nr:hypothetical protein [Holzapfeliella floricola]
MKINDFIKPELLGNNFAAVRGYSEVLDRETNEKTGYKLDISIQDPESDFFMELFTVKVKNVSPTLSYKDLEQNKKIMPVVLENLNVGQFNGNLWYNCSDVLPANKG